MKNAFRYDRDGEFCGIEIMQESPLEPGVFLLPADCTEQAPPEQQDGMAIVWNGATWTLVQDVRGLWYKQDGSTITLERITDEVDQSWSRTATPPSPEQAAAAARTNRNGLLAASDWTQVADAPLTADEKSAWKAYRQALRDITGQAGFPESIDWPESPA